MRNKETITLFLPQGIAEKYEQLYRKHASYVCPELQVQAYNNVFVSHEGLCLRHFRLLPYSTFNIRTRYDRSFGWQYYKLVLEQYLVSTYGKSLEKIIHGYKNFYVCCLAFCNLFCRHNFLCL